MLARVAVRSISRVGVSSTKLSARQFGFWTTASEKDDAMSIPTDKQQQFGRRKIEIDMAEKGEQAFADTGLVPTQGAGTKESPIMVNDLFFIFHIY